MGAAEIEQFLTDLAVNCHVLSFYIVRYLALSYLG
ncbi:hypothetical protein [Methylocucumis oryzae]